MDESSYTAFVGTKMVKSGALELVLGEVKALFDWDPGVPVLIFEDQTGRQVDFDFRGSLDEVVARVKPGPVRSGPGRPKLGVVAREVSLLPRHWEWLEQQPSGASAALRKMVDEARKRDPGEQRVRQTIDATGRFLSAIAGNLPRYEEATRALYGRNRARFEELIRDWPADIQLHATRLVSDVL